MATEVEHECNPKTRGEAFATAANPYHFADSGLSNVYLVGIRYVHCECGQEAAEIPAAKQLLNLIARNVVEQPFALSGDQIRFLRKRLGKKQEDFAKQIGIEIETLSRVENGHLPASERTDKFIRLYYALAAKDRVLLGEIQHDLDARLETWQRSTPANKIVATITNDGWATDLKAN